MNYGVCPQISERERMQNLFDSAFVKNDSNMMREQYKALRSFEFDCNFDFKPQSVNISAVAENISAACDTVAAPLGVSFIYCGNQSSPVSGNRRLISKALLNLLSNAYLYGSGSLVTVKTVEMQDFVRLEVQSGGMFLCENEKGRGLSFVRRVCVRHGGKFFIESDVLYSRAVMILPKSRGVEKPAQSADFITLITDRLSPVYVEFFGMEYH